MIEWKRRKYVREQRNGCQFVTQCGQRKGVRRKERQQRRTKRQMEEKEKAAADVAAVKGDERGMTGLVMENVYDGKKDEEKDGHQPSLCGQSH